MLLLLRSFFFSLLLLFALPLWADQLIVEPDMGRKPILMPFKYTPLS